MKTFFYKKKLIKNLMRIEKMKNEFFSATTSWPAVQGLLSQTFCVWHMHSALKSVKKSAIWEVCLFEIFSNGGALKSSISLYYLEWVANSFNVFLSCPDWICFSIMKSENHIWGLLKNFWKFDICPASGAAAPFPAKQNKFFFQKLF